MELFIILEIINLKLKPGFRKVINEGTYETITCKII